MRRTCDRCGGDMTLRSQEANADGDDASGRSSSAIWWDCTCGRTLGEFSASTSATVISTVEDEPR